jgi:hypothetical protein
MFQVLEMKMLGCFMWRDRGQESFEPDVVARRIFIRFLFKLKILNYEEHYELARLMRNR